MGLTTEIKKTPRRRRAVAIQLIAAYVNKGIVLVQGFIFIPLYLHYIGNRMYGLWLASGGILAWLGFMDLNLGGLVIQRVSNAYGRKAYTQAAGFFVTGLFVYSFLALAFYLMVLPLSYLVPHWFHAEGEEIRLLRVCFQLAGLAAGAELLNNCLRGFAQALQRPLLPMLFMICFRILGLVTIFSLLRHGWGLWSIPSGLLTISIPLLLSNFLFGLFLVRGLGGSWRIDRIALKEYWRLGMAMFAGRLGGALAWNMEPTAIAIFINPELVPAFVITKRAAEMVSQLLQVINASFFPSLAHLYAEAVPEKTLNVFSKVRILCFGVGVLGFTIYVAANRTFVELWTGSSQFLGTNMTLLMALGLFMGFLMQIFSRLNVATGDVAYPSLLILAEALCRVALMSVLLIFFGLLGLPLAMVISCAVFSIVFFGRLNNKMKIPFPDMRSCVKYGIILILFFSLGVLLAWQVPLFSSWLNFGMYLSFLIVGFTVLMLLVNPQFKSLTSFVKLPTR